MSRKAEGMGSLGYLGLGNMSQNQKGLSWRKEKEGEEKKKRDICLDK